MRTVIAGAGIFGATAAVALARRGHRVTLVDPGPLPHPLAASTDISKVVRLEYGPDEGILRLISPVPEAPKALKLGSVRLEEDFRIRRVDLRNLFGTD